MEAVRRLKLGLARIATPSVALLAAVMLAGAGSLLYTLEASGDQVLPQRSVQIGDANASATTTYKFGFTIATPATLGSIKLLFCSNSPLVGDPCTPPSGLDASIATLSSQTGETGFSVAPGATANQVVLTRAPAASSAQAVSYTLAGVVNPSALGSYYARVQTYASTNASGGDTDYGGLAFAINSSVSITTKVPPYLLFCNGVSITNFDCNTATGDYIDFGNFSANTASSAQTQMLLATNAPSGYSISYNGLTLTSGNNVIPGLATGDVSRPGTSQFGMNLVANQDPAVGQDPQGSGSGTPQTAYNQANVFRFNPNDIVASSSVASDFRKYTVSYIANVSKDQAPGVYVSTLTYVTLANF